MIRLAASIMFVVALITSAAFATATLADREISPEQARLALAVAVIFALLAGGALYLFAWGFVP